MTEHLRKMDEHTAAITLKALNDVTDESLKLIEADTTRDYGRIVVDNYRIVKGLDGFRLPVNPGDPWDLKRTILICACASLLREITRGDTASEGGAE